MELSLSTQSVDEWTVLTVAGEVDVYTAPRLRERLVELVESGSRMMIVNIQPIDFLDSTGLGVMVGALKRLRAANGQFGLVCAKEPLLKIFRVTALDQVFPIYPTVAAAMGKPPEMDDLGFTYQPPKPKVKKRKTSAAKAAKPTTKAAKPTTKAAKPTTKRVKQKDDHRADPPIVVEVAPNDAPPNSIERVELNRMEPGTADQMTPSDAGWQGYWNGYSFTASQSDSIVAMYTRYHLSLLEISGRIGVPEYNLRTHLKSVGVAVIE